jgi:hypothetical protein
VVKLKQVLIWLKSGQCIECNGVEDGEAECFRRAYKLGADYCYDLKDENGVTSVYVDRVIAVAVNDEIQRKGAGFDGTV